MTKVKYPDRSCALCKKDPCFIGKKACVCDFAKYGCSMYIKK